MYSSTLFDSWMLLVCRESYLTEKHYRDNACSLMLTSISCRVDFSPDVGCTKSPALLSGSLDYMYDREAMQHLCCCVTGAGPLRPASPAWVVGWLSRLGWHAPIERLCNACKHRNELQ